MASTLLSNRTLRGIALVIPVILALSLSYFHAFDLYELQTYDWRCQIRGPRPVSDDIVLVDIWNDTLKELGAWPFDRNYHAELIKVLSAYGVKAVGMDVLFVEPREGDDAVAEAALNAGNVYFVYAFFQPEIKKGISVAKKMLDPLLEAYQKSARANGHVNASADLDGKRRKVFPAIYYEDKPYYQLSFRIAMDVLGVKEDGVVIRPGKEIEFSKSLKIPLDDQGFFLVNYAGKWEKTYTHYSYYDILAAHLEKLSGAEPRIDLEKLRGKICFVGLTSLGSHDTSPVPIQAIYPMVGMHANVLNSILKNDFIRRLDRVFNLAILLVLGFWIVWISVRLKPVKALFVIISTLLIFAVAVVFIFIQWGLWADLFYPLTLFLLIYAGATLGRTIFEVRKRELIENELKIASQIQKSFLPSVLPEQKGVELAVYMKPAKAVGGDLYNFIKLNEDRLGVMVGDVSGKGTPAALFMAKVVSEFKFSAREKGAPAQALSNLNHSIASEDTGGLFVTLTYAIFDRRQRKLVFANGGHLPIVLVRSDGKTEFLSGGEGMPIGVLEDAPFSDSELEIREGDCLALYSDGISEARNRKKEELGADTLQGLIVENRHLSAQHILDKAIQHIHHFTGKADQHDDMTLIIVKIGSLDGH